MTTLYLLINEAAAWLMEREDMRKADALTLLRNVRDKWAGGTDGEGWTIYFSRSGYYNNGRFVILIDDEELGS